jgi:bacterioferritin-associated ferredoxin
MPATKTPKKDVYDRCLCSGLPFSQIKQHADQAKTTSIKRLKRELEMGMYCSACVPYLRAMFQTGKTRFTERIDLY